MFVQVRRSVTGAGRWMLLPVVAVLGLASVGTTYENIAERSDQGTYAAPGESYQVSGHRMHLDCRGHGGPTVVLFNGLGEISASWARITGPVGRHHPGLRLRPRQGRAGAKTTDAPQDGVAAAKDLHTLLAAAGETGPFVLVGHSTGGTYAMTYAARYPEQVAGMVLLDSSSPYQLTKVTAYPGQYAVMRRGLALLPTLARLGVARLSPAPHLPAPAAGQVKALTSTAKAVRNGRDEISVAPRVFAQAQALTTLGNRPLAVLTASESLAGAGWAGAQDQLAALSTNRVHRTVDSTHAGLLRGRGTRGRVGPRGQRGHLRRPHRHPHGAEVTTPQPVSATDPTGPTPTRGVPMSHTTHPDYAPHSAPAAAARPATASTRHLVEPAAHEDSGPRKSWALLAVALAAQILVVLDISVVNTALPSIGSALHLEGSQLQWLVTAYLMMSGGGLLLGGRIADLLSRRRVFLTGLSPVHRRLPGQRVRRQRQPAHRGPRRPGTQRRAAHPLRALADHDHLRRRPAQDRARHVGRRRQPRRRSRRPPRRRADHLGQLAGHLLDQRPRRPRRPARRTPRHRQGHRAPTPASATSTSPAPWPSSAGSPPSSTGSAAPPPTAGGPSATVSRAGALRGPAGRVPQARAARGQAAVPAAHLEAPGPRLRHRRDARRHRHPGRHRLPDLDLPPDRARLLRPGDRARVPAVRARHHRRHRGRPAPAGPPSPRASSRPSGCSSPSPSSVWLSTAGSDAHFATDILPGLSRSGLGVGMVFVPVSVTSMAGIPASHAGVASGFLMTGHEIGAALGVAVLSAVASSAGSLATATGAADAFSARVHRRRRHGCRLRGLRTAADARHPCRPAAVATCTCTEETHRGQPHLSVATDVPDSTGESGDVGAVDPRTGHGPESTASGARAGAGSRRPLRGPSTTRVGSARLRAKLIRAWGPQPRACRGCGCPS